MKKRLIWRSQCKDSENVESESESFKMESVESEIRDREIVKRESVESEIR